MDYRIKPTDMLMDIKPDSVIEKELNIPSEIEIKSNDF